MPDDHSRIDYPENIKAYFHSPWDSWHIGPYLRSAAMPDEIPMRTCELEYTGGGTSDDWFDDVLDVFERHGLKIEACMDGPTDA